MIAWEGRIMLDQSTIENAQSCMSQVADVEALVAAFYDKLFATHPDRILVHFAR